MPLRLGTQIRFRGAGSATAPVVSRDGDTNTGTYFPAADQMAHAVGGEQQQLVKDNQNVFNGEVVEGTRKTETKSANYTMDAEDTGKRIYIDTDAFTITLPATVVGLVYEFVNAGADGAVAITLSPNASDKIMGPDIAGVDNKDLINTKATARKGDRVKLFGDGVNGWFVMEMVGTWAAEG